MPRSEPRIYGLTYTARFPEHLYDPPVDECLRWTSYPTYRVWPVHFYARGIELEAMSEGDAIARGAARLGYPEDEVRICLLPPVERQVA